MGRSYEGKCNLCGSWGLLTDDHLPQKSLYPKSIRASILKMNSVKACSDCNNGSNKEDEVLKVILGNVAHSYWNGEMWNTTVATLDKNRKLDRLLEQYTRVENVLDESGNAAKQRILKIEKELKTSFLSAMERIVKGLFYQEYGEVLIDRGSVSIFSLEGLPEDQVADIVKKAEKSTERQVNSGTCRYIFVEVNKRDIVSVIELYRTIKLHYVIQLNET